MEKLFKNKKLFFGLIALIFIVSFGASYAYFGFTYVTDLGPNDIVTETGELKMTFADGPQIVFNRAFPGDTVTKTFSVENTGTLPLNYSINWLSLTNTIINNELVLNLGYTSNKNPSATLLTNSPVGTAPGTVVSSVALTSGEKHTYTMTVVFKEMSSTQNYNQGKMFSGVINIFETGR